MDDAAHLSKPINQILIRGARCALGARETIDAVIKVTGDRIGCITAGPLLAPASDSKCAEIDLSGFLLMPGLINAHDHLQFALYPRLGEPPYRSYIDWGEDIHNRFPDLIAMHRSIPKHVRLWWGGIRNLLCGVTTVCHHDPLWAGLQRQDFPVRVVQRYGWAHSTILGGDLVRARSATPAEAPFILHACEGVDERAREELYALDQLGLLDDRTVLVHGLALDDAGFALMRKRGAALIVCPSSNMFLFGQLPKLECFDAIQNVSLGSDSPLTAIGDLLDEIRFATSACSFSPESVYRMVTESPATILRLKDAEGSVRASGTADMIAVRDTGLDPADRLQAMFATDIEFVMIAGRVYLASETIWKRLPSSAKEGLEPLWVEDSIRWLRAPVEDLLRKAETVLSEGNVRVGGQAVRIPEYV